MSLHKKYKDKGFQVLAFPANNFNGQEPGTNKEIKEFCSGKGVEFPVFAKISVKGDDIDPLYKFLTSEETNKKFAGDIKWNFQKFLVNRRGRVIARFDPKVSPDSEEVVKKLEKALAQPAPKKREGKKEQQEKKEGEGQKKQQKKKTEL